MTNRNQTPSFWKAVWSAMGAFIGVQKKERLEEDFSQKNPLPFIVAGLLLAMVFVTTLIAVVNVVLAS